MYKFSGSETTSKIKPVAVASPNTTPSKANVPSALNERIVQAISFALDDDQNNYSNNESNMPLVVNGESSSSSANPIRVNVMNVLLPNSTHSDETSSNNPNDIDCDVVNTDDFNHDVVNTSTTDTLILSNSDEDVSDNENEVTFVIILIRCHPPMTIQIIVNNLKYFTRNHEKTILETL